MPFGAPLAGSPSANQIHELPSRDGASVRAAGAETHVADQSPESMRPVSHQAGALHGETAPSVPHTWTDQKYRFRDASCGPAYGTRVDWSDVTFPLSQTSGRDRPEALEATRIR